MHVKQKRAGSWKAGLFLLSLLLIVVVLFRIKPISGGKPEDIGGEPWADRVRKAHEREFQAGFTLEAGQNKVGWVVSKGSQVHPIIYVQAKFPVSLGYLPSINSDSGDVAFDADLKRVAGLVCEREHITRAMLECDLNTKSQDYVLVIKDDRQASTSSPLNEIHVNDSWVRKAGQ